MVYTKYVSYELGASLCFNGGNDTKQFILEKDGTYFDVYHSKPSDLDDNIVVLEEEKQVTRKRGPHYFYHRTFPGKHPGECDTEEEVEKFMEKLRDTISPEFRMTGPVLKRKLEELVRKMNDRFRPRKA